MKREDKQAIIDNLADIIKQYPNFYITDTAGLTVDNTTKLRRLCFNKGVKMRVAKNSLIRKAMEKVGNGYEGIYDALKGTSAILFSDTGNVPAKIIKEFRKTSDKPLLKGAYIESAIFLGDNQLETLSKIKSKNELIGEVIGLLQSPARNVISALQSGGGKLAGIVKTLSERPQ
jgi:large subunit ribosomal protein L10